jgi:hypothetical protein
LRKLPPGRDGIKTLFPAPVHLAAAFTLCPGGIALSGCRAILFCIDLTGEDHKVPAPYVRYADNRPARGSGSQQKRLAGFKRKLFRGQLLFPAMSENSDRSRQGG